MVQTMPSFPAPLLSWIRQGLPRQQTVQEAMAELAASQPQVVPKVSGMPPVQPVNYTGPLAPLHVEGIPPDIPVGTQVEAPYRPALLGPAPAADPFHANPTFGAPPTIRTASTLPPPVPTRAPFSLSAMAAVLGAGRNQNTMPRVPTVPQPMMPRVSTAVDVPGGATMNGKPVTMTQMIGAMKGGIPWGMPYAGGASPYFRMATGMSPVQADRFADAPRGLSGFADNSMQDTQVQRDEQQRLKRLTGNY